MAHDALSKTRVKMAEELPMLEVERHREREDAWVVVGNTIYDVTDWLASHPGGSDILLSCAGTNATQEFEDVGHSADAREHLASMAVASVREATPAEMADAVAKAAMAEVVAGKTSSAVGGTKGTVGEYFAGYSSAFPLRFKKALSSRCKMLAAVGTTVAVAFVLRRITLNRPS